MIPLPVIPYQRLSDLAVGSVKHNLSFLLRHMQLSLYVLMFSNISHIEWSNTLTYDSVDIFLGSLTVVTAEPVCCYNIAAVFEIFVSINYSQLNHLISEPLSQHYNSEYKLTVCITGYSDVISVILVVKFT